MNKREKQKFDKQIAEKLWEIVEELVKNSNNRLRFALCEKDDSENPAMGVGKFLKLDEKRLGHDINVYRFVGNEAAGWESALLNFYWEILRPIKKMLPRCYKQSAEKMAELAFPKEKIDVWRKLFKNEKGEIKMADKKTVNIRRFKKDDHSAVNELLQTFTNYTKTNVVDEKMVKILASRRDTCAAVVTVEENGKETVVGFGMINFSPVADKNGFVGIFEDIVINPNYRGFGLATNLCKKLIAIAKKRGAKEIKLTSNKTRTAAHKLYEKLGFKNRDTIVKTLVL